MAKVIYIFKGKFPWDGRLIKICNSLQNHGHKVLVVARWKGEKEKIEIWKNLKVWRACVNLPFSLSIPFPENPFWLSSLKQIFSEFKPDVVIVRDIFLVKTSKKALKGKTVPVLIDMAEHYPAAVKSWRKYNQNFFTRFLVHNFALVDKWEAESIQYSDGIITVCDEQKDRLVQQYKYPEQKIEIVHNTPELSQFSKIKREQNPKPRVFLHHGYHTTEKPIDQFLRFFIEFANPMDGFQFVVAGAGECIPYLEKIAEEKGAKNVVFTGYYDFETLPQILQSADIGVIPYPANDFNNYTLHNKVFDYLAVGIPILCSEAKPLKRLVDETKAGVSLPIEREAIRNFFQTVDSFNWVEMSQNAIKFASEKYNWAIDEQKLLKFVEKVLNG